MQGLKLLPLAMIAQSELSFKIVSFIWVQQHVPTWSFSILIFFLCLLHEKFGEMSIQLTLLLSNLLN